jgi:hypothetical protein
MRPSLLAVTVFITTAPLGGWRAFSIGKGRSPPLNGKFS